MKRRVAPTLASLSSQAPYDTARGGERPRFRCGGNDESRFQWLRRQRSVSRRGILVAVALSMLGVVVADNASAASKSTSGGATLALPKTSAEVAPFVAPMDDRQARSLLVRVLEERTQESKPMSGA